ncbi:uncharacterized protein LOC141643491 [Silene latifolia]|uniref:uncharacterized protein LOC141643491 n=1 Tax=Silene latifolia TaxID=37657 RepID=UPI003D782DB0
MVGNEMEKIKSSKKLMTSHTFSGTFPSPESTPGSEDGRAMGHYPKGWYSERVPQSGNRAKKGYAATAALLPFSSGRALPSKWDDAERWISSPVSVGNVSNYGTGLHKGSGSHLGYKAQRRAKSKSGPLGPAGSGLYGNYNTFSPVLGVGVINGGKWRNSLTGEPSAEVGGQLLEGLDISGGDSGGSGSGSGSGGRVDKGRRRSCPGHDDPEWMNMWTDPFSHNDKHANDDTGTVNDNDNNNAVGKEEAIVDRVISRRDMATQMYPESETSSLYSANSPISLLHNNQPNMNSIQSPEFEVRDVQIDRQTSGKTQRRSPQMNESNDNFSYSTTIVNEDDKTLKIQREEARINAWENLQKANAESAIQKLEMKLEKKRAASMEKIIERLRRAEIKAQKMRGSLTDNNSNGNVESGSLFKTSSSKFPSFCRKIRVNSTSKTSSTCFPF